MKEIQRYNRPKGAKFVAFVHTHPNPNGLAGLSPRDFRSARNNMFDMYSVGYDGSVHYYNCCKLEGNDEKIKSNVKIFARRMSKKEKESYEKSFRYKWNAHIKNNPNCPFGCKKLRWPVK